MFKELISLNKPILVYENCVYSGSLASILNRYCMDNKLQVNITSMCIPDDVVIPCGDVESIKKHLNIAKEDILNSLGDLME